MSVDMMGKAAPEQAEVLLQDSFPIQREDFLTAGDASGTIKRTLKQLGIDPGIIRRVAIAAYEAELNLVIHSLGGSLTLRVSPDAIRIIAEDCGPGIADVDKALQEGYSTASENARMLGFGAGMGLSNMRRCSDHFKISSVLGEGTCVEMTFCIPS